MGRYRFLQNLRFVNLPFDSCLEMTLAGTYPMSISEVRRRIFINPRGLKHAGGVARWGKFVLPELKKFEDVYQLKTLGIESENHITTRISENIIVPLTLSKNDVLLSLCNWGPLIERQSIVIHDIAPIVHPEFFSSKYAKFSKFILPSLLRKSKQILTVSDFTKSEIMRVLNIEPNKISVVGASSTLNLAEQDLLGIHSTSFDFEGSYMVLIGSHDPRKNLPFLLNIWNKIYCETGLALLVVGQQKTKVFSDINYEDVRGVFYLGQISDLALSELLKKAECLLSPSIYEGFGLPIIEALLLGTPVIASPTGVATEIESPNIYTLELDSFAWQNTILNHKKQSFNFEWKSWNEVAEKIHNQVQVL